MIRKGQVPTDPARRDAMRDLVDQRLHRTRHRKTALVVMAVLLTAVAASTFFTTSPPRAAAYCVFSAASFAYLVVVGGAALHRLRRLRDSLGATAQGTDRAAAGNHSARHAA
ncbi:hypothetical protein [Actinacidiphila acidipaludis]|uniref:Uncharacterized protein n=1 Tax=Actinacidiphila acidipaludis TaxID=2873382 RepID=A0ABS7QCF6_9ACTN|nr:hypothetical protein [Streptomyces acidipaludis]MBY8880853.1 hypothetical protein [Streptomyces acidipaludis]